MKKTLAMLLALMMVFTLLAGCGGGGSADTGDGGNDAGNDAGGGDDVIVMKLANGNPAGDIKDRVAIYFSDLVAERSEGRVRIDVYSGGQLGDWTDTVEGLKLGMNEIVLESLGALVAFTPLSNIDQVSYMYRDAQHYLDVMGSDLGQEIIDTVGNDAGFKMLGPMYRGVRVTTSKVPFTNLEELAGLKIRVPNAPIMIDIWKELGASPTPLALTETFTALQQNTVAAQENSIQESYGFGFYDAVDYLVRTDHTFSSDIFIFDLEYFNNLPEDVQELLTECANEAAAWRSATTMEEESEYLQKWVDKGVTVIDDVDTEAFAERVANIVPEKYPELQEMMDKIQAFE